MARSGILYGPTGSFKTTAVKHFAHYIADTTGKSTILLSADGGGWGACQPEIDAGMILAYPVDSMNEPLMVLRKFSQGYRFDAAMNLVPVDWNEVGGYAVEGWTSISQAIMRYLPDKGINVGGEDRNKLGGFSQTANIEGQVSTEHFRSSTRGDYGFVQNQLYGLVMNFNALPVRYVLYTALEAKTEDDDRSTTFGPSIAGKKATAQCGAWVGDMLHAQDYQKVTTHKVPNPANPAEMIDAQTAEMVVRMYFKKHPDPATGIPFPAKPRVTPERIAELDKRFPSGYFEPSPEHGLDLYLKAVDELSVNAGDALKGWRDKMDAKLGRTPATISK